MFRFSVAFVASVCVAGIALAESHSEGAEEMDAERFTAEAVDLEAAEKLFKKSCRACHGNKAQGVASYPKLNDKEPAYIAEKLETYRAGERVGPNSVLMINNARDLSDEEIDALAVYVTTAFD